MKTKTREKSCTAEQPLIVSDSLAVKYRPTQLEQVIGNYGPKAIIQGMLNNRRFPNSLLLHGPHGQGKTTLARLIARYLNCQTYEACGTCPSCELGDQSPDIIEMNMADTRKIDDVRALIEKSRFSPRFNYRVFILDELHQCLTADTLVLMADGSQRKICEVKTYDAVVTANPEQLKLNRIQPEAKLVAGTFCSERADLVTLEFEQGAITCTGDHPFYSWNSQDYVWAKDLVPEERLATYNATEGLAVNRVHRHRDSRPAAVYDLTTADNHNFFVVVGQDCVLCHNCTPDAKEAMLKPLEEPPAKTLWILCTTNPEKLSPTILSRCQQIKVEAPSEKEIGKFLIAVAKQEGFKLSQADLPLIKHIAVLSQGHTRNALQLLENVLAMKSSGTELDVDRISQALSLSVDDNLDELAAKLLTHVLAGEGPEAVKLLFLTNRDTNMMAVLLKVKYLIDSALTAWAGAKSFPNAAYKHFLKIWGKRNLNVNHLIMVLNTLIQAEITIKTVSALDERTYFSAVILNDMVKILSEDR